MDLRSTHLKSYQLLDTGDGRKLEKFGSVILDRPSPGVIWPAKHPKRWQQAHAVFNRKESGNGDWSIVDRRAKHPWQIVENGIRLELRLTGFGNVGVFPEHSVHWPWMTTLLEQRPRAKVLNMFAYTGAASLICAGAKADVTHVDAAKAVNNWARKNCDDNGASGSEDPRQIRLVTEDALKYVKREQRRGRRYDAIILDPPTFGRGAKGEVWKIDRDFYELSRICLSLLVEDPLFVLLTSHSPGVTPSVLSTLLSPLPTDEIQSGEMLLVGNEQQLPSGVFARWSSR